MSASDQAGGLSAPRLGLKEVTYRRTGALLGSPGWSWVLAGSDALALGIAFAVIRMEPLRDYSGTQAHVLLLFPPLVMLLLATRRMYTRTFRLSRMDNLLHIAGATSLGAVLVVAAGVELDDIPANHAIE